ncbi:hypothetical protein BASA50_001469 [Batrachochytrium salamandrivorans]|uniref:Pescadillo homolog n=1 Tax=Batrachochytrium salamandrivorans TaxID=1357716 RepID=A0ABQ8FNZ6_9FUNG|nr:hypothetical protein BASA62_007853 [Batrachochytrium salamandrivorans]KAH6583535.1 hypothetical protein BASA60_001419 [Batrachochytrium salamandrivorans]KAH6596701.1 hypothetical protein BASA61_003395 [Batrachochytrium salamandrivorans]KAH6601611.1 hypothetical protein BASA50_001469 [Batrachochytrium salamandrivorans]KAH9247844.1 hypothetical protein BASA81_014527 [Batrachochytrium salamandrivorans]
MGGKVKKGEKGNTIKYVPRSQAIKKLQISLAQFRRLCILKGIYPVEPKNKRQVTKGSTLLRTYYFRKDIQFLLHEPVLRTFREQRSHRLKVNKAIGKKQFIIAKQLQENRPNYTLDHIIKERYPSFVDALRDLDDALSMIFLFATLPTDQKIPTAHIRECQRLSVEFKHYVISSHSLKKTFVSIKGIYYQAEIRGQLITWITPFQFSQSIPVDVDFRVMRTFLEIYETLVGFVNYKLYSDLNLVYPPKIDVDSNSTAVGLSAFIIENKQGDDVVQSITSVVESASNDADLADSKKSKQIKQSAKRIKTLTQKIHDIETAQDQASDMSGANSNSSYESAASHFEADTAMDMDVPLPVATPLTLEETVPTLAAWNSASSNDMNKFTGLFSLCVFWLSREVPRDSLEFVIKAFGGRVGWDSTSGSGSPFMVNDPRITHHICDRPVETAGQLPIGMERFELREYVQPQWVYDAVNADCLVKTAKYRPGETLPPHLSPFESNRRGDYVPGEDDETEVTANVPKEEIEDVEAAHQAELEAEAAGVHFSNYSATSVQTTSNASVSVLAKNTGKKAYKLTGAAAEEAEAKELAKKMMSKRDKKLYDKIQQGKRKKAGHVEVIKQKKRDLLKR